MISQRNILRRRAQVTVRALGLSLLVASAFLAGRQTQVNRARKAESRYMELNVRLGRVFGFQLYTDAFAKELLPQVPMLRRTSAFYTREETIAMLKAAGVDIARLPPLPRSARSNSHLKLPAEVYLLSPSFNLWVGEHSSVADKYDSHDWRPEVDIRTSGADAIERAFHQYLE